MITPIDTPPAVPPTGETAPSGRITPDKAAPIVPTPEITATGGKSPPKDADKSSAMGELTKGLVGQGVPEIKPTEVGTNDDKVEDEAKRKSREEEKRRAEKERKRREIVQANQTVKPKEKPRPLVQRVEKKSPPSDPDAWLKEFNPIIKR